MGRNVDDAMLLSRLVRGLDCARCHKQLNEIVELHDERGAP